MKMWLVGAGYWGSKLLQSLEKFSIDAQIIDIRNGQTIADINTSDPVMLATPLWQHYEQACELLKRGHDVYVEKPLAETLDQVQEIETYIRPGQLLMVGHLFVHHPQMTEIKHIISSGIIGQLKHISSRRLNWGIYQTKTDPLLSLATHDITIVQAIANSDPKPDTAVSWNYSNNVQPDRVWFSGHCNDISFDIDVSWHWPVRTRQTVIVGTQGQITWDQDANTVTVSQNHIKDHRAIADTNPKVIAYSHELSPLEAELGHWADCLHTRTQPGTGLAAAKMVAKTIDQVKNLI
jgi:predicted dehydrogenase